MVDTAGFNLAFAGIALSCDSGTSWSLQRIVGPARAKELLLLPRTVPADECLSLGLVTKIVPADEFEATVHELATTLAAGPTLAYGSIRRAVAFSSGHRLTESLANEGEYMTLTGATSDHRAAVTRSSPRRSRSSPAGEPGSGGQQRSTTSRIAPRGDLAVAQRGGRSAGIPAGLEVGAPGVTMSTTAAP